MFYKFCRFELTSSDMSKKIARQQCKADQKESHTAVMTYIP